MQDVVRLASHRVALQHFGKARDLALKSQPLITAMARQRDITQGPHPQTQRCRVEQGHITADQARRLQPLYPPADLGGRQMHLLADRLVGGVRIALQRGQQADVARIER